MIEVLLNDIAVDGMRRVKVMSDHPVTEAFMRRYVPGAARGLEQVHCHNTSALSLFYGEVVWPCREVVRFQVPGIRLGEPGARLRERWLVVWKFVAEEEYRLSEIILFLADWYFVQTHQRAGFAFVKKLSAVNDQLSAFEEENGIQLLEAEWALKGCVMVGG